MCHYFGHFYLTIIVTSRTLARPMRSMKANQIAVSQVTATDGFRETGRGADSSVYPIQNSLSICECEIALVKFHPEALVLLTHFGSLERHHLCAEFSITHITKGFPVRFPVVVVWCGECSGTFAR